MKTSLFLTVALTVSLSLSSAATVTPYSSATVGTINATGTSISINRSDITNPTQTLSASPTVIGYGAVGRNTGTTGAAARHFWQVSAYRVSDLLITIGSSNLSDLANYSFTYTGVTEASTTDLPDANPYSAAYLGQWTGTTLATNTDDVPLTGTTAVPNSQNMTDTGTGAADTQRTLFGTAIETLSGYAAAQPSQQTIDLSVLDAPNIAQTLTATGFNLSHLAADLSGDSDLTDNFVFFSFYLNPKLGTGSPGYTQAFTSVTLEAVPETGAALLGCLGLLAILRRRR